MTIPSGFMKSNLLVFTLLLLCIAPSIVSAAATDFIPLVGIPGIADSDLATTGFGDYINALYRLSISIAALLAVIKIVAAGAKYMLTDIVPQKEEAKNDIRGAILGLLVIIGAVIILTTINTDITKNTIAIDELTNLDGTNHLDSDIQNLLNRLKSKEQALCERADASIGERCTVEYCESGDCSLWCSEKKGVYTPGSYVGLLTNDVDILNKCTYLTIPEGAVTPGDVSNVNFTAETFTSDQITLLNTRIEFEPELTTSSVISTSELTLTQMEALVDSGTINETSLTDIQNVLSSKCSGGTVKAVSDTVGEGNGEPGVKIYCVK